MYTVHVSSLAKYFIFAKFNLNTVVWFVHLYALVCHRQARWPKHFDDSSLGADCECMHRVHAVWLVLPYASPTSPQDGQGMEGLHTIAFSIIDRPMWSYFIVLLCAFLLLYQTIMCWSSAVSMISISFTAIPYILTDKRRWGWSWGYGGKSDQGPYMCIYMYLIFTQAIMSIWLYSSWYSVVHNMQNIWTKRSTCLPAGSLHSSSAEKVHCWSSSSWWWLCQWLPILWLHWQV